jgi:serine protease AprX
VRRNALAVVVSALVAGVLAFASPVAPAAGLSSGAFVDPALADVLAAASPTTTVEAAVVLPRIATATDLTLLTSAGVSVGAFKRLPVVAVKGTPSQLLALQTLSIVRSIWFNSPVQESLDQSTAQLQATEVWREPRPAGEPVGYTGRGVGVATIDSGIDGLHPGIAYPSITVQNVKPVGFKDLVWGAAVEDVPATDLLSGHGSHVAGIIAGRGTAAGQYKGVAPGAHLIGLGASDGLEMLTILQSYDWILQNKDRYAIRVINNSWAHSEPQVPYVTGNPLDVASKAAADAGLVVVFAAGNAGQAGDVFNNYARNDWVVSVGGVDKNGRLASFSSRGNSTHHANVMAPGHFIASARATMGPISQANATPFDLTNPASPRMVPVDQWPYYTVKSGTSMAAPHVSGVVALMLEANASLTPAQARSILISTARPVPGCAVIDCGAGTVNALAAVRAAKGLAANAAPVASLSATPASGQAPLTVSLDASASTDADGTIAQYRWDFDGDSHVDAVTTSPTVTRVYDAGVHRPRITVVDDRGLASASAGDVEIRVSNPPHASAFAPARAKSGAAVTFDASASTDPDGDIVAYEWNFGDGSPVVTTSTPTITHTYSVNRATVFGWAVRVVDAAGVADAAGGSIRITP